jgi:hypothetical protein
MKRIFILVALFIFLPNLASAHPGMTDSRGGHYCWTNCELYGEVYGQWHYHGLPNTYYKATPAVGTPMSFDTLHELMKSSPGYKKVSGGYKVYDLLTCKDGYTKKKDKCEKPKAKKLKASKEASSLSSSAKNEKVRFVNTLKKKRYIELEDLTDVKWKKFKKEILENVPKTELIKYAPDWFIKENKIIKK